MKTRELNVYSYIIYTLDSNGHAIMNLEIEQRSKVFRSIWRMIIPFDRDYIENQPYNENHNSRLKSLILKCANKLKF